MNIVPVANQRERKQQQRDHQQSGCLGGVDGVAPVAALSIFLGGLYWHGVILAPELTTEKLLQALRRQNLGCYTTPRTAEDGCPHN